MHEQGPLVTNHLGVKPALPILMTYLFDMKLPAIIPVLLILCSCTGTGHYDAEDFELVKLKSAAPKLFTLPTQGSRIEQRWWPPAIAELKPISVRMSEFGIYIELDSFFVEQSGLFIPAPGITIDTGAHHDPSYRLLGDGIYSYHATG